MQNSTFQFSIDRPFGVTPLSTRYEVIIAVITYLAILFGGKQLMKNFPVIKLQFIFQVHNLLLTLASYALLILFAEQLVPIISLKYWELIDTIFLVLRKKNLEFLHVYHHSMTMALCYSQLEGRTSVSWVPITLNLMVHVFMYYYYFRAAGGARLWWKQYITTLQITQFIIDLFFVYFCSYTYFTATYWDWMPNSGSCAGSESAAIFGCELLHQKEKCKQKLNNFSDFTTQKLFINLNVAIKKQTNVTHQIRTQGR
ncbi:fatty acid elongase [Rhizophagus clarus]|uniref:Elongation of fatty acids protein n=1 Tax=Rhizophagus clarus TaxID=94130 RepID=A0A8H3QU93_9GLOM|nr:fatty acid elongase [Rhizophagus clarus]